MPAKKKSKRANPRPEPRLLTAEEIRPLIRHRTQREYGRRSPICLQPNYQHWQQISIGMDRSQVESVLGPPLKGHRGHSLGGASLYGFLALRNVTSPLTCHFSIGYDAQDRVNRKSDPFVHPLSTDGLPSKPRMILPLERSMYSHFPRLLDIRWHPSSGQYPMEYEVQVGLGYAWPPDDKYVDHLMHAGLYSPWCVVSFPGCQPGRVRVRGVNQLGAGEWSDYRCFIFASAG